MSDLEASEEAPQRVDRLTLKPLDPGILQGKINVEVDTAPEVERVIFVLNGKPVARRRSRPFKAKIDIGRSARTAQLVAVAFDRDGNELDRDRLVINEPPEAFWVRIIEPGPGLHAGPTDVEARVKVPDGARLEAPRLLLEQPPGGLNERAALPSFGADSSEPTRSVSCASRHGSMMAASPRTCSW